MEFPLSRSSEAIEAWHWRFYPRLKEQLAKRTPTEPPVSSQEPTTNDEIIRIISTSRCVLEDTRLAHLSKTDAALRSELERLGEELRRLSNWLDEMRETVDRYRNDSG